MGLPAFNMDEDYILRISQEGITRKEFYNIVKATGLSLYELSELTHITPRTVQRKKDSERISPDVSERAIFIENIFKMGTVVFNTRDKFLEWINTDNPSLKGNKPKELFRSFAGIKLVEELLGRINYGLYS